MLLHRSTRRAAFSLLEVVLVVVIIFLLILALIPAFRGKRVDQRYQVLPRTTPTPDQSPEKPGVPSIPITTPASATPAPAPAPGPEAK